MIDRELTLFVSGLILGSGLAMAIYAVILNRPPTYKRQLRRAAYVPPSIEGRKYQRQYKKIQNNFDADLKKFNRILDKF
jgi:hypothetical protein